jgi:ribosomal protein S27AE
MSRGRSGSFLHGMLFGIMLSIIGIILLIIVIFHENIYSLATFIDAIGFLCIPGLLIIVGLILFFSNLSNEVFSEKQRFCPNCKRPLAWNAARGRWMCHHCDLYY